MARCIVPHNTMQAQEFFTDGHGGGAHETLDTSTNASQSRLLVALGESMCTKYTQNFQLSAAVVVVVLVSTKHARNERRNFFSGYSVGFYHVVQDFFSCDFVPKRRTKYLVHTRSSVLSRFSIELRMETTEGRQAASCCTYVSIYGTTTANVLLDHCLAPARIFKNTSTREVVDRMIHQYLHGGDSYL